MRKTITTIFATLVAASAFALTPAEAEVKATVDSWKKASDEGTLFSTVFASLPESHQLNYLKVAKTFAEKMDPMVWTMTTEVAGSLGKILETKSEFIENSLFVKQVKVSSSRDLSSLPFQKIGKSLSGFASITLEDIKAQPDAQALAKFLDAKLGSYLFLICGNNDCKYAVYTEADGDLVVCFDGDVAKPGCRKCVEFKKVGGKWLPEDLAEPDFDDIFEGLNEINFASEEGQQFKMRAIMHGSMAKGLLASLLQAKTQEEFDAAFAAILGAGNF